MTERSVPNHRVGQTTHATLFKNNSAETVPPFACLQIADDFTRAPDSGRLVFPVIKPDAVGESAQHAARMMFNLGWPVAAGSTGLGTLSLPAFALVDEDVLGPGFACGPADDSWSLHTGGLAYTVRGRQTVGDDDFALVEATDSRIADAKTVAQSAANADFTAELMRRADDGSLVATGLMLDCYNDFNEPIPADTPLKLKPEPTGAWSIVVWACD